MLAQLLVGFGGIAQMLVRFLAPFEPRLLAYDPFVPVQGHTPLTTDH